ncbi:hypothetical protein M153_29400001699, partial [Pseudoloma neurophilia]
MNSSCESSFIQIKKLTLYFFTKLFLPFLFLSIVDVLFFFSPFFSFLSFSLFSLG